MTVGVYVKAIEVMIVPAGGGCPASGDLGIGPRTGTVGRRLSQTRLWVTCVFNKVGVAKYGFVVADLPIYSTPSRRVWFETRAEESVFHYTYMYLE